jgi:hypothetical protein
MMINYKENSKTMYFLHRPIQFSLTSQKLDTRQSHLPMTICYFGGFRSNILRDCINSSGSFSSHQDFIILEKFEYTTLQLLAKLSNSAFLLLKILSTVTPASFISGP